jgi:nitrogen-specific signal transduction histidine kinase
MSKDPKKPEGEKIKISVPKTEEEWRQWAEQYHQAQKMETIARLAGMSQDFNSLLIIIRGYSELLLERYTDNNDLSRDIKQIIKASEQATVLTRQLLDFSREMIEPPLSDLNMIMANNDKLLRRIIGENIELKTLLSLNLWSVGVDPGQIEEMIMNLMVNARDAMPEGGRITVETANVVLDEGYTASPLEVQPGQYVLLAVSDTGIGMSAEVKAHIFEPFFTTKEPDKGTGLGLATVFGIVKQRRGDIWVYSEEGFGTTFKIYLPRAEKVTLPLASPEISAEMPTDSETILLVEDDMAIREVEQRLEELEPRLREEARGQWASVEPRLLSSDQEGTDPKHHNQPIWKIEPCPFCGGQVKHLYTGLLLANIQKEVHCFICQECGIMVIINGSISTKEAIEIFNQRGLPQ